MRHQRLALWLALCFAFTTKAELVREFTVSEGAPVGTPVGYIGDELPDAPAPYTIVPVPSSQVDTDLYVDQNTGEIRTKAALDRERRDSYSLIAIPTSGDNIRVLIRVLDENDNAPTFPSPFMRVDFSENTPRDVKRKLNPARDLDIGLYNTQRYEIVSGNADNAFRLSSHRERDGVLYLDLQINGVLDRETVDSYKLVIEALDGGTPPLKGNMTVNISILDVNDNPPIFTENSYSATVPENATVNTFVLKVSAQDADAGENGQIEYSINRRQSDRGHIFEIDYKTGEVTVNKPLDFETKELHELVVVARDRGMQPLETTCFVTIRITDVNDNRPTIDVIFLSDDATPKITESAQPGEFVARISVHDPDSKTDYSNANVTLVGGDKRFELNIHDNIIYLVVASPSLDREEKPDYTLSVVATDSGSPPLHASREIKLRVTDINDNPPVFSENEYKAVVPEAAAPGTAVIQISATDADEGENAEIRYSLLSTPQSEWFSIDSRSGLVTIRARVDCETNPMPKLTVLATDRGKPSLSASSTILITVLDVNDNEPVFDQSFYNVTVSESEAVGHCFIKVSAVDPDCGVNSVVNYTSGTAFGFMRQFRVIPETGEICIAEPLDYEMRNVYDIPIVATDRGGLFTTAVVKVQLIDVNDNAPEFTSLEYNVTLRAGRNFGSEPIITVSATDADSGRYGMISYRLLSGDGEGIFRVDRSGSVFVARSSAFRPGKKYDLEVTATDGGGKSAPRNSIVHITILDQDASMGPFQKPRYNFTIREDAQPGTIVGILRPANIGETSNLFYSIISGDTSDQFKIDPSSGTIKTKKGLDWEKKSSYLIAVAARNGNPPTYDHTQVAITVEDVNDNAPKFDSPIVRVSVSESSAKGAIVYSARATDEDGDARGKITYSIIGTKSELFSLNSQTGLLTLKGMLDYEEATRHTVIIKATDNGYPPLTGSATLIVDVQDANDNAPFFERAIYRVSVIESELIGTEIAEVRANDKDSGNNARITYKISKSDGPFMVESTSGRVYLSGMLDREKKDSHSLTLLAHDNGVPQMSASTKILIEVNDANDNYAVWSATSYTMNVQEGLSAGVNVGRVMATDADIGDNSVLHYSLLPPHYAFSINPSTGEIFTRISLDREEKSSYGLIAEARDQGIPSRASRVTVLIKVKDVNDNAPEFIDPKEDVVSVREEQPSGTEVARLKAIDKDEGENASISYAILEKEFEGYNAFTVDSLTGVIKTKYVLNHDERPIFRLSVSATDKGKPPKETIRQLRVEVLDLNDNRPTFTSSSLHFKVKENVTIGHVIGKVICCENSISENLVSGSFAKHIFYTLIPLSMDNAPGTFEMDRRTGSLIVARQLDRESQEEYRIEVRALDTSTINNPQSSAITVRIDVEDINDNAPKWKEDPITITVSEDLIVSAVVYNFSATDVDFGLNGEVFYMLMNSSPEDNIFNIDSLTGSLTLVSGIDYERVNGYILTVRASDSANNSAERLFTDVTVKIIIKDCNDNAPIFVSGQYTHVSLKSQWMSEILYHAIAVDKDSGDNGRISYMISGGNDRELFSLSYDTGRLTFSQESLSKIKEGRYNINITALDHGVPNQKRSQMSLTIDVKEPSQTSSSFVESFYKINVSEDVPIGTYITTLKTKFVNKAFDNLTFVIPYGLVEDTFSIDERRGTIFTKTLLDREKKDLYTFPVYIMESTTSQSIFYDLTSVLIYVTDVNDNAPVFQKRSCYPLTIPENNQAEIVHTVAAKDADIGLNSVLKYTITGGNFGNKFSIEATSGHLSSKTLDYESEQKYILTITAQDHGTPSLQSSCNITVFVANQNDIDPVFELPLYTATIDENIRVDTSVLKVKTAFSNLIDSTNIVFSLSNETDWLFKIHNETGVVSTAGYFDREKKSVYNFMIVATDIGGNYARSNRVPVEITIKDVNDNKPIFTKYPFSEKIPVLSQPGQSLMRVTANDNDVGLNADILYELEENNQKFRINPTTGVITNTQSLASDNGKLIRIKVLAKDKGIPPQSSTSLVELRVGDTPYETPTLAFRKSSYNISIPENPFNGKEVLQVTAIRSDVRRQTIIYEIVNDHLSAFYIDEDSGIIRVLNSSQIDYEKNPIIKFVVVGRTEDSPILYAYCQVTINLIDQNDNAPRFTQQEYLASILEGNSKGEYVMQLSAVDSDEGANSRIIYHIVDGNHDNAFIIEPAFSAVVRTNIVLDREIRDIYRLTVIATDAGVPQLTGSATLRINVIDINDNKPTFPPRRVISIPEDTSVGTVLTALTANDVDLYPALKYSITHGDDAFSIDRYSGKIVLRKQLDYEAHKQYVLNITASDSLHATETTLTIKVTDVNDNVPIFEQSSYQFNIPVGSGIVEIGAVKATDLDSNENARISYSLLYAEKGFNIEERTGKIFSNLSEMINKRKEAQLIVIAKDNGKNQKMALCPVQLTSGTKTKSKSFTGQDVYRLTVFENEELGKSILQIGKSQDANNNDWQFYISSGNEDSTFEITSTGTLVLLNKLDRESKDLYILFVNTKDQRNAYVSNSNTSAIKIFISIGDVNDNPPIFNLTTNEYKISEYFQVGQPITNIVAHDIDLQNTENSQISFTISSGDDHSLFYINKETGVLTVNKTLDYDSGNTDYNLILKACDNGKPKQCTLENVKISIQDENDNTPIFPVSEYYEYVAENERIGTSVFTARATDLDRGFYGKINYSIAAALPTEFTTNDDSWNKFSIDTSTGLVTTKAVFDFEKQNKYTFAIIATDLGGKSTTVPVKIEIDSRDEYYPQFTQKTYNFVIAPPASNNLPSGYVVGQVTATDRDKGVDGKVIYQLSTTHSYFKINRSTGVIILKKRLDNFAVLAEKESVSLVVTASSGQAGSLTNKTAVEITLDPLAINTGDLDSTMASANGGISDWALGLIIALLLIIMSFGGIFLFLHMKNKRHKKINKPGLTSEGVGNSNSYVDPSAFDTIPIRGGGETSVNSGQFAPPKYDEIPPYGPHAPSSNSGAPPTSEISGSDRSGSSGRGSAEDGDEGEDEEIRAINERPMRREISEDDNLSDVSVHNTQEYLARLGIVEAANTDEIIPRRTYRDDADLNNLIYAKLNDVTCGSDRASEADEVGVAVERVVAFGAYSTNPGEPVNTRGPSMTGSLSSIVHSEEELTGSYNWDYLLDWGPRYQPLAHVFSEIARLKDDASSTRSGDSSRGGANSTRSAPPPLITAVAAMRCAAPTLGSLSEPVTPFNAAAAMCPSFSPSLSPLATRSPSISPLVAPGLPGMIKRHKQIPQHPIQDATLRL